MAKNEAKIKFTAETGEFNKDIKSANSSMSEFRSELKLNSTQMKNAGESADLLKKRQEILKKELEAAKDKTEALSKKLEAAERIFGENSEEAKKLQTQLNNAKNAEEAIQGEIEDTNKKLKNQKDAFDQVSEKAEKAGEKLTNVGKKMSVVSAGIAAVGGASIAAFNEVDEGADNVIKATGATGEMAAELEDSYKKVASSVVGDFGDIGSALGEVNTRFGFTGDKLEGATTKFLKFSEVTGMDATSAVQAVSRAIESAGLKSSDYESILDSLTAVGQATGVSVDTLAQSLTDNGAAMREMGFNTNDSIAMLAQFEKAGIDANTVTRGMRTAIVKWGKDGKDAETEFAKLVKGIQDGSVSAGEAYEVFGSRAGVELVDAIESGRFSYESMVSVVKNSKGTLDATFDGTVDGGYEMELAMQNAKVALGEVGNTLSTSLTPIVNTFTEKLKSFSSWWSGLDSKTQTTIITIAGIVAAIGPVLLIMGSVASAISKISNAMKIMKTAMTAAKVAMGGLNLTFLASPITWIIAAIVALIAIFVVLWNKCDWFREFWINLWEKVKNACSKAWEAIKGFFEKAWSAIKNVWSGVKNWFSNVWSGIKNVFSSVGSWFREKFNTAKQGVQNAWSGVKNFFSNIWSGIKNTFSNIGSFFSNAFTKAKEAILKPINAAKDKIRGIVDSIKGFFSGMKLNLPKIKLPHFKITGKLSLSPPSVPKLKIDWYKDGGIMMKPTIFGMNGSSLMAGGEAGPEAILPIDRLQGYISGAIEKSVQTVNLQTLADSIEALADRPVIVKVNDRAIAQATASAYDNVNGQRSVFKSRGLELD